MSNFSIRPIPFVKNERVSTYKHAYLVGSGSPQNRGIYAWYIEGPKEKIMVDTGVEPQGMHNQSVMFPEGGFKYIQSLEEGLGKIGLKPEDIDIVIVTHMHEDHMQFARKYPKAEFIVQRAELEFARKPHPVQQFTYLNDRFEDIKFHVIEGDKTIVSGLKVVLTPGHTPGAQSVIVETAKGNAIITGFCCTRMNFEPPKGLVGIKVIPPGIHLDVIQAYNSVLKVKKLADIVIPNHDSEFLTVNRIP